MARDEVEIEVLKEDHRLMARRPATQNDDSPVEGKPRNNRNNKRQRGQGKVNMSQNKSDSSESPTISFTENTNGPELENQPSMPKNNSEPSSPEL